MKKKILITLSRVFPQTHSRRGEPTGFGDKLIAGTKIHTIRRNYDLWAINAEKMQKGNGKYRLSIRQWSDKPYRSKQEEICFTDVPIRVEKIHIEYNCKTDEITAQVSGQDIDPVLLAKNDGLSLDDFKDWFVGENRRKSDYTFNGVVIHFTRFRYAKG
ncbi:MAG: hypothetical protein NC548_45595 [Lachnospiraceae bacterium]|nr:hypothetical protein [Bacteroides sp.]MCM1221769.1 hypothetical protein [Lachnospiraceae bacterium]MCM1440986.1 hypothetical protein [Roseburia sp.]